MNEARRRILILTLFVLATILSVVAVIALSIYDINAPIPHSHEYEYSVQTFEPTCTDDGYILHTCECGDSYKTDTVDALGHDYAQEFTVDSEPDCTKAGSKSKHCSRCESTAEVTEIAAYGHTYGEWETRKQAECEESGVEARVCETCSDVNGRVLRPLGHDIEYTIDVYYHKGKCNRCKSEVNTKHVFEENICVDCEYEVHPTQGLEYELNEDGASYTVKGIGKATDVDLVIFSTYNGLPVTSIGQKAFYSFNGSRKLDSVIIYDGITELQDEALANRSLKSITISQTLTYISPSAFTYSAASLSKITVDGANPVYHSIEDIYLVKTDTKTLYLSASGANKIPADGSITSIGDYAFYYSDLTGIEIPDTITSIGDYAFYGSALTDIIIPNTMTKIGKAAFDSCRNLTTVEIPSSVKRIEDLAFSYCKNMSSIVINDGVTSIGSNAFSSTKLTEIFIPKSVTQIDVGAFEYINTLAKIKVDSQNSVYHSYGNCLIETMTKILHTGCKTSVIPDDGSVTAIGDRAFRDTNLQQLVIPHGITSIGFHAFDDCDDLCRVEIPESVIYIGSYAFSDMFNKNNGIEIIYNGTFNQWSDISKGSSFYSYLPKKYAIRCTDYVITEDGGFHIN